MAGFESAEQTIRRLTQEKFGPGPVSERECIMMEDELPDDPGNFQTKVSDHVAFTSGSFITADLYRDLNAITPQQKNAVRKALSRLCDKDVIKRYGTKDGVYRRVDTDVEKLNWKTATTKPMKISWPFCIEDMVNVFPGNIAVLAGAPNAGKSAFVYNFIKQNMHDHEVHLFSSEGGAEEMHQRLSKFGLDLDEWNFSAWERGDNFADVIRPDAINVIDYLEVHDDFFKVGGMLKEISDKIGKGFALICIQKNKGRDEGLGGMRSLEKPRLYMAMDHGKLKIVKGKSWVNRDNNPNNQVIKFKIVDGCQFLPQSKWEKEEIVQ